MFTGNGPIDIMIAVVIVLVLLWVLKKFKKISGILPYFLVVAVCYPVVAQDDIELDIDDILIEVEDDLRPITSPAEMPVAATMIASGVDYLAEEAAISDKIRSFLGSDEALNITLLNNSTGLFYA